MNCVMSKKPCATPLHPARSKPNQSKPLVIVSSNSFLILNSCHSSSIPSSFQERRWLKPAIVSCDSRIKTSDSVIGLEPDYRKGR